MIDLTPEELERLVAATTQGPWVFSFESTDPEWAVIATFGGSVIANVNADHRQDANAALIALAPDLARDNIRLQRQATADASEIARLLEALVPFANACPDAAAMDDDRQVTVCCLTMGDFRNARAALAPKGETK